jgi:hypothetical protein
LPFFQHFVNLDLKKEAARDAHRCRRLATSTAANAARSSIGTAIPYPKQSDGADFPDTVCHET